MDHGAAAQKDETDWIREEAQIGLDQIGSGQFIEEHEMEERVARMLNAIETRGQEL